MFDVAPMAKLELVVLTTDAHAVIEWLGRLGVVELQTREIPTEQRPISATGHLEYGALLARVTDLQKSLELATGPPQRIASSMDRNDVETSLRTLEFTAAAYTANRKRLIDAIARCVTLEQRLDRFSTLDLPLDLTTQSRFVHARTGTLPRHELAALRALARDGFALVCAPTSGASAALVAFALKNDAPALDALLARHRFVAAPLPVVPGHTATSLRNCVRLERERLERELDVQRQVLAHYADDQRHVLTRWQTELQTALAIDAALGTTRCTDATTWITGWTLAANEPLLRAALDRCCQGRFFLACEEARDNAAPVLLHSPRWLRPFEPLLLAFGHPQPGELVPTLFMAVSYVLMFGLMFGDVGQGLLLAVCGWLFGRRRAWGPLLTYTGLASAMFGWIYGSFFGLPAFKQFALWRDPLEGDPMALMRLAVGFGCVLITLGAVLHTANRFRARDLAGGWLDKFGVAGVVFYWSALAFVVLPTQHTTRRFLSLVAACALAIWIFRKPFAHVHRPKGDGFWMTLAASLVEAFEGVLLYLANTISFVRLAAYAMSHAALLAAFFAMAESLRPRFPAAGIVVVVVGNLVAMLLEGVIAAVQALRLEYYEFFGKFFSGNGRPFRPFVLGGPAP